MTRNSRTIRESALNILEKSGDQSLTAVEIKLRLLSAGSISKLVSTRKIENILFDASRNGDVAIAPEKHSSTKFSIATPKRSTVSS